MNYIVFDMEFNQDFTSIKYSDEKPPKYLFEIIQIGAVKLDSNLDTVACFNRYIKPDIYSRINPFITDLTGITTEKLLSEESFTEVYKAFIDFIHDSDSVFCVWGMSDIKELYRNADYYGLNKNRLPELYINLQSHVSQYLKLDQKKLLKLQDSVEALNILKIYEFHNAYNDAFYTAEIFKKIKNTFIEPKLYDPSQLNARPRQRKREIDYDRLLRQFEKMYDRKISAEEQGMILLAYKMGRTNQFIKKENAE